MLGLKPPKYGVIGQREAAPQKNSGFGFLKVSQV